MKIKRLLFILCLLLTLILMGCTTSPPKPTEEIQEESMDKQATEILTIYTTLYPIEDFTNKIGNRHVEVTSIIPPGVDTHTYEPSTKTMIDIAEADAFIYNSSEMESYAKSISTSLENEDVMIVEAINGIDTSTETTQTQDEHEEHNESDHSHEEEDVHHHGENDPHIWLDPILSIHLAENIKNTLIELKPEAKNEFEENFQMLKAQLTELDSEFQKMIDEKSNPKILVSHAAYGYWEKRYGVKQIAVTGLSPSNEPSQRQLESIIEIAKENNIDIVIFEQNVTPKISKIVQDELDAEALYLHNLEVLTDDDIQNGEDYFSLMRKNIQTLNQAMY